MKNTGKETYTAWVMVIRVMTGGCQRDTFLDDDSQMTTL
jgi:hypothetical protein